MRCGRRSLIAHRELFESAVREAGDLAGIFEHDGSVAYFYLYAVGDGQPTKILDQIRVFSGTAFISQSDVDVRWDATEQRVGLFLRGVQWAVFNCFHKTRFGGGYRPGERPEIPH